MEDWPVSCLGLTCLDKYAPSHTLLAGREAGAVAAQAELRKDSNYAGHEVSYNFVPVAIETTSVCGLEGT